MMTFFPILSWSVFFAALAAGAAYPSFRHSPASRSRMVALAESALALFLLIPAVLWVGAKLFHVRVDLVPVLAIVLGVWLLSRWLSR